MMYQIFTGTLLTIVVVIAVRFILRWWIVALIWYWIFH